MKPWLVVGHFGGNNSGDEAMLLGMVAGCSPLVRQRLIIITKTGKLPSAFAEYDVQSIPAQLRPVWHAINDCAGVVLGGGTHFHDDYVRVRYLRHVRYLLRYLLLFSWAKLRGKKVLWLGMGIGPLRRPLTQWLLDWGVQVCDHVTVREAASAAELASRISPQKLTQSFDLAALACQKMPHTCQKEKIVGVSVLEATFSQTGQTSLQNNFWSQFTTALENVYRQYPQVQIRVFVIRGGKREDDRQASQVLVDLLSKVDPTRVVLVPYHDDPTVTIARIAECEGFIATRFHAAVFSYLAGCRLLLLAYHRKLQDLAHEIGLAPIACIDIAQPTTIAELVSVLQGLVEQSPNYIARLPVEEAQKRAQSSIKVLDRFAMP